jgi:hypothetical protein
MIHQNVRKVLNSSKFALFNFMIYVKKLELIQVASMARKHKF